MVLQEGNRLADESSLEQHVGEDSPELSRSQTMWRAGIVGTRT